MPSTPIIFAAFLAVALAVGLALSGRRRLTFHAVLGFLAWLLSLVLADAWRLGEGVEAKIIWYQVGMTGIVVMYLCLDAVMSRLSSFRPLMLPLAAVVALGAAVVAIPGEWVIVQKSGELFLWAVILARAVACWRVVDRGDFLAQLVWLIVVFYEGTGLVFHLDCQLLHGAALPRVDGSACDQVYESPVSVISAVVTATALVYTVIRYRISDSRI